jgi:hypothetical protein
MSLSISAVNALWLLLALIFIWMLYRFQKNKANSFELVDLFVDHGDNRASLTNVIIFMMALMSIWVCIDRSNDGKDTDNLVLGVLGIFVLRQAIKIGADAYVKKDGAEPEPVHPVPMGRKAR